MDYNYLIGKRIKVFYDIDRTIFKIYGTVLSVPGGEEKYITLSDVNIVGQEWLDEIKYIDPWRILKVEEL